MPSASRIARHGASSLSSVNERTLDKCTPSERCTPEQAMQIYETAQAVKPPDPATAGGEGCTNTRHSVHTAPSVVGCDVSTFNTGKFQCYSTGLPARQGSVKPNPDSQQRSQRTQGCALVASARPHTQHRTHGISSRTNTRQAALQGTETANQTTPAFRQRTPICGCGVRAPNQSTPRNQVKSPPSLLG